MKPEHENALHRFRILDLDVDLDRQTVRRDNRELELPELSFRLLAALIRRAPEKVSKDELIREVWSGLIVSDETLAQRVRLLRQALGEDSQNPRYIASVRGHGYRLKCAVAGSEDYIAVPVRYRKGPLFAGVVVTAIVGIWLATSADRERLVAVETVAVMPFADLSADQSSAHFADGMQEELLTRLTSIKGIDVVSRTSVERFRSTQLALPEIARQIGADAIIEGSVRIADNNVRITVQLIDAHTDRHLWADNFDQEMSVANLFLIQEEVAEKIAQALQFNNQTEATPDAIRLPTDSLEAYDAYLLGRYHAFRPTAQNLEIAVTWLTRATKLDPEFAEAYASLGWAYSFLGTSYGPLAPDVAYPLAKEAALRALALDGELADAHSLYADILTWYDWDFAAAQREYLKAAEIDPLNVLGYALFLSIQLHHSEAIAMAEHRVLAEPDDQWSQANAAWRYLNAGQIENAINAATRAADHPDAIAALGYALMAAGNLDRAIRVFEAGLDKPGNRPAQLSNLATVYFKAGRRSEGQDLLDELEAQPESVYVSPALLASVYFAAGDTDAGFALLDKAVAERAREVIFLQVSQMLNGHRDDPRYTGLVQQVGFN